MAVSAQTMLDNIEAAINAKLTGGAVESYAINGRNIKYYSLTDLYSMRDKLKREIAASTKGSSVNYASFEDPK